MLCSDYKFQFTFCMLWFQCQFLSFWRWIWIRPTWDLGGSLLCNSGLKALDLLLWSDMCMHSWVWVQKFIRDYTGLLSSSPSLMIYLNLSSSLPQYILTFLALLFVFFFKSQLAEDRRRKKKAMRLFPVVLGLQPLSAKKKKKKVLYHQSSRHLPRHHHKHL